MGELLHPSHPCLLSPAEGHLLPHVPLPNGAIVVESFYKRLWAVLPLPDVQSMLRTLFGRRHSYPRLSITKGRHLAL